MKNLGCKVEDIGEFMEIMEDTLVSLGLYIEDNSPGAMFKYGFNDDLRLKVMSLIDEIEALEEGRLH